MSTVIEGQFYNNEQDYIESDAIRTVFNGLKRNVRYVKVFDENKHSFTDYTMEDTSWNDGGVGSSISFTDKSS